MNKSTIPDDCFRFSVVVICLSMVHNCLNTPLAFGQQDFQYERQVDALVQPYLDHQKFYAASIGIIKDGQVFTRGYGQFAKENPTQARCRHNL